MGYQITYDKKVTDSEVMRILRPRAGMLTYDVQLSIADQTLQAQDITAWDAREVLIANLRDVARECERAAMRIEMMGQVGGAE